MLLQFLIFFLPLLVQGQNERKGVKQPVYWRPRIPPRRVPWTVSTPLPVESSTAKEGNTKPVVEPIQHEEPAPWPQPVQKPVEHSYRPRNPYTRPFILSRPIPKPILVGKLVEQPPTQEYKPVQPHPAVIMPPRRPVIFLRPSPTLAEKPISNLEPSTPVSELKPGAAGELIIKDAEPVPDLEITVAPNPAPHPESAPIISTELKPAPAPEPSKTEKIPVEFTDATASESEPSKHEAATDQEMPATTTAVSFEPVLVLQPATASEPSKNEEGPKPNQNIPEVPIEIPAPEPKEKERQPISMSRRLEGPPNSRPLLVIPPRPIFVPTLAPIEQKPEPKPDKVLIIEHTPAPEPEPTLAPEHLPHLRPLPILPPRPALRPVPEKPKSTLQPEPTPALVQPPHLRPLPILPPRPALRPVPLLTPAPHPAEKEPELKPHEDTNSIPQPEPTVGPNLPPEPPLELVPGPLVTILPTPLPTPAPEPIDKETEPKIDQEIPTQSTPVPQLIEKEPESKPDEKIPVEPKPAPEPEPTAVVLPPVRPVPEVPILPLPTISTHLTITQPTLVPEPIENEPEPTPDQELPEKFKPAPQPEPTPAFEYPHLRPLPILPPRPIPRPIPGIRPTVWEPEPKPTHTALVVPPSHPYPPTHILNPYLTPKPKLDSNFVEQPTPASSIDNELRPDEEPAKPKPTLEIPTAGHEIPIPIPSAVPEPIPFPSARPPIPTRPPPEVIPTVSNKLPFTPNNKPVSHYIPLMDEPLKDYACKQPNGYFVFENNCDTYVECRENAAFSKICPDGLHFNPAATWPDFPCSYPTEVKCGSRTVTQPPQPTSECPHQYGYFPINDGDCSKFTMCQEGLATIMTCPAGLVFNPEEGICDWVENVPSCHPNAFHGFTCPAPPIEEDGRPSDMIFKYRYGKSCKEYVACQRGQPRLLSCDRGLRFDEVSEACIDSDYVKDCEGQ